MTEYSKPPITEAVIELRPKRSFTKSDLDKLEQKFLPRYPNKELLFSAKIEIKPPNRVEASTVEEGRKLSSTDGVDILMLKQNSFCASRLAPYCGWTAFFERFLKDLEVVRKVTKSSAFGRMGLRYINRIDVPATGPIQIEDYLKLTVNTPEQTDVISRYSLQVVFPMPEFGSQIIVNSGILPPPLIDTTSFLLDVDVSSKADNLSYEEVVDRFNVMRGLKNDAFERYVTDKARMLFD